MIPYCLQEDGENHECDVFVSEDITHIKKELHKIQNNDPLHFITQE